MDVAPKKLYMREHSNVIRIWSSSSRKSMVENPAFQIDRRSRIIIVTICRIRQRLLKQAWQTWIEETGVRHNYTRDLTTILSRQLPPHELRTELEIEVLYKWVMQAKDIDPTGIASTIYHCKKKSAIYNALQQLRLEYYGPGEAVIYQGDYPRVEDGHFTVIRGECDVLQFTHDSGRLTNLLACARKKKWDEARELLVSAQVVARISTFSGFGELSTLTGVKRAATIVTSPTMEVTEILVLPKHPLLDLLKYRNRETTQSEDQSEAIDFLRQSGLANRISPKDLVLAASSMSKRTLKEGDILYYKGEDVKCIYLVVSGEFLLDTNDFIMEGAIPMPFVNTTNEFCYSLTSGSILGDEGVIGEEKVFESTAAVVSSVAVVFRAEGFAMNFIAEKMGCLRYSALYYRDRLCWEAEHQIAEQINPYTYFDSLRKSIAYTKPFRGTTKKISANKIKEEIPVIAAIKARRAQNESNRAKSPTSRHHHSHHHGSRRATSPASRARSPEGHPLTPKAYTAYELRKTLDTALFPRSLRGLALHRALEINKIVKKFLQNCIKIHAKENILHEELKKQTLLEGEREDDTQKVETKNAFDKSLRDYYDRSAEFTRKLAEATELARAQSMVAGASAAVRFFSLAHEDDGDSVSFATNSSITASVDGGHRPMLPGGGIVGGGSSVDNSGSLTRIVDDQGNVIADPSGSLSKPSSSKHSSKRSQQHNIYLTPPSGTPSVLSFQQQPDHPSEEQDKMKEYFEWIDGLKRQQYRALANQSKYTIALNEDYTIEAKIGLKLEDEHEVDWKEISEVFHNYSLTPADLHLPWLFSKISGSGDHHHSHHHPHHNRPHSPSLHRPSSPKPGILKSSSGASHPHSPSGGNQHHQGNPISPKSGARITFDDVPKVAEIPPTLPSPKQSTRRNSISNQINNNVTAAAEPRKKSVAANRGRRGGVTAVAALDSTSLTNSTQENDHEAKKIRAQLEHNYKGYVASDARDEYVQKKAVELGLVSDEFVRYKIPDNRRTLRLHVKVHIGEEEQLRKDSRQRRTRLRSGVTSPNISSRANSPRGTLVSPGKLEIVTTGPDGNPIKRETGEDPPSPGNQTTLTGLTDDSHNAEELAALRKQLMEYIDSPEAFLQFLFQSEVNRKRRLNEVGYEWNTRFMATQENQKRKPPPVLQAVRTHLQENLESYSKEALLQLYRQMKEENYQQAMKAILGKEAYLTLTAAKSPQPSTNNPIITPMMTARSTMLRKEPSDSSLPTPSLSRSVSNRGDVVPVSARRAELAPFLTPDHRQSSLRDLELEKLDPSSFPALEAITESVAGESKSTSHQPTENHEAATITTADNSITRPDPIEISKEDSMSQRSLSPDNNSLTSAQEKPAELKREKSNLKSPKGSLSRSNSQSNRSPSQKTGRDTTPKKGLGGKQLSKSMTLNSISTVGTPANVATPAAVSLPLQKISDVKAPSKALQMFEEFMQQQQIPSKAASEGRKKANRSSRFRLPAMIAQERHTMDNIHEYVNLHEVQKDRLKMELTIFQALNPHYTLKDKEAFIETFKQLNPRFTTTLTEVNAVLQNIEQEIRDTSDDAARQLLLQKQQQLKKGSYDSSARFASFDQSSIPFTRQFSSETIQTGPLTFETKGSDSFHSPGIGTTTTHHPKEWEEQFELERWQEYTIQNIVQNKNGERKTLPVVKLPKQISNATFGSGRRFKTSSSTKGVLVTLPAKKDEEPIEGPTGYLELYKSSFKVRTSSKAKERIVQELKQKLPEI